jgi:hypothetical protein
MMTTYVQRNLPDTEPILILDRPNTRHAVSVRRTHVKRRNGIGMRIDGCK